MAVVATSEMGDLRASREIIPEPTVTDGIVSKLGAEYTQEGTMRVFGTMGDAFQLSVNATGAGNSGGPVFNAAGRVIGLFTYGVTGRDGTRVTHAVPIKHGRALLEPQKR
jgi:S1-C subfamily serine protease